MSPDQTTAVSWKKWTFLVVVIAGLAWFLFGRGPSAEEVLANTPLANPTLSFGEQVGQATSDGGGGLIGSPTSPQHVTRFEFPPELAEDAFEEIRAQAEDAGYALELVSPAGLLPAGNWTGTGMDLRTLTILISNDGGLGRLQVTLR